MSVTYTAVLPVRDETVEFLASLLAVERVRRGTRADTRSLSCHDQTILILRWFCDGTRMSQLARDNAISKSTGYDYLHEGIDVLAAKAPGLHGALLAAKTAGYSHVNIDGTLVETDRCRTPGPTPGVDLWWSGILPALADAADDLRALGDLGYEGESDTITVAFKKPKGRRLTLVQQQLNKAHNSVRAIGERGNSLLKMTFKALRNVSLDPWRIGKIVAAALVILHFDHARTT